MFELTRLLYAQPERIGTVFSVRQKREIADKIQALLRETNHPELPSGEISFSLHVDGAESWSWEVTGVRLERLCQITPDDAGREGIILDEEEMHSANRASKLVPKFRFLWESINGPGSWDADPLVWVILFRVV